MSLYRADLHKDPLYRLRSESKMKLIPIESSILESVCYDPPRLVLTIAFRNGSVYEYAGVPEGIYRELIEGPSKGKFFHKYILGVYEARRG